MGRGSAQWISVLFTILSIAHSNQKQSGDKGHRPPHIILIIADDVGWNDVGWNNHDMITPNLNKLAKKGVILQNLYVLPVCTPTRAALLTGYYPYRLGLQNGVIAMDFPKYIPEDVVLLPERLKQFNYSTHHIGKWHLGSCNIRYTPTNRGFDSSLGPYSGVIDHYTRGLEENNNLRGAYDFRLNERVYRPPKEYVTNIFTRRAQEIITSHDKNKPLYLQLSYTVAHTPLQVPHKFEKLYRCEEDDNRRKYSAMVTALDEAVGNITTTLRQEGFLDNALIFFLSDNGGTTVAGGNNLPYRGQKTDLWEGGTKSAAFVYSKTLLEKTGYTNTRMMHAVDLFPTILSLAGGVPGNKIDGRNQWAAISKNAESARDEFVYNINELAQVATIRVGKFKLLTENGGSQLLRAQWLQLPKNSCKSRHGLKSNSVNNNQDSTSCPVIHKGITYSLYDIENDPEERHDIACHKPDILKYMIDRLREYKAKLVPAQESTNKPGFRSAVNKKNVVTNNWCY